MFVENDRSRWPEVFSGDEKQDVSRGQRRPLVWRPGAVRTANHARWGALRLHPRSNLRVDGWVQIMRACSITFGYDAVLTIGAGTFLNEGSSVCAS